MNRLLGLLLAAAFAMNGCGGGGSTEPTGTAAAPSPGIEAGAGAGDAGAGGDGTSDGTSAGGTSGSGSSGSDGTGVAVGAGNGGVGSGGTGIGTDGSGTGVAGIGGDGSGSASTSSGGVGVGSGGTGATASAVGIGSVDGFGSIIVNGVRYEIGTAILNISDATELKLGMTVQVTGTLSADMTQGTATHVRSAAELRGPVQTVDAADGTFRVLSMRVTVDEGTFYGGVSGLAGLRPGEEVQIWGLPSATGELRATRVEKVVATFGPILSGPVQNLSRARRTLRIGGLTVDYASATVLDDAGMIEGATVRVRGFRIEGGVLIAQSVQLWQGPRPDGTRISQGGLVSSYTSPASFRLDGVRVDASAAQVTGGRLDLLTDGTRVEVAGVMRGGVLVASRLKIRREPVKGGR